MRVCNIRRFYRLRELYEADFHNPASMEAGEDGLTRGMCFVARRLELVAVAGLLWLWWRALGGADFFVIFFFFALFFFERTRSTASMGPPCLIYLSTSTRGGEGLSIFRTRGDELRLLAKFHRPVMNISGS